MKHYYSDTLDIHDIMLDAGIDVPSRVYPENFVVHLTVNVTGNPRPATRFEPSEYPEAEVAECEDDVVGLAVEHAERYVRILADELDGLKNELSKYIGKMFEEAVGEALGEHDMMLDDSRMAAAEARADAMQEERMLAAKDGWC